MRPVKEKAILWMIAGLSVAERQLRFLNMDDFQMSFREIHQSSSSELNIPSVESSDSSASSPIASDIAVVTGDVNSIGLGSRTMAHTSERGTETCGVSLDNSPRKAINRPCHALLRQPL